jgi:hypothetical protein
MPCYDASAEYERRYRDAKAAELEALLCAVFTTLGLERVLDDIDLTDCGVAKQWIADWWEQHQRKDEIRRRMQEANATHVLRRMIEREEDIEASVAALEAMVPAACETYAPPCPTASGILTTYFGNVRVVKAFDPIEGRMLMRADLYYREQA